MARLWPVGAIIASVGAIAVAACSPLTTLNTVLVPKNGFKDERSIAYGPLDRHRLDVYRPVAGTMTASQPAKVVIFFYGGSWKSGERSYYRFVGEALTSRGFVAVVPDYRLYPDTTFPGFVEDGARVVRWVRDNIALHGGDPERIVLMGHSAGAHIAALLAANGHYLAQVQVPSESIRGFVGLAGPYAFDPLRYRMTRPIFGALDEPAPSQPITFVDGDEPPMLLLHGTRDQIVLPDQSRLFAAHVRARGGHADLVEYPDLGHIGIVLALASPFRAEDGILAQASDFIGAL
jgi:acetyl esterase/lipase